jgi:signal transduction histidine kinase
MKDELTYVKVEATGFQDLCNRIRELEEKNQALKCDNDFLQHETERQRRMINGLKLNNSRLTLERNELNAKLQNMIIFDLSEEAQEQAGHLLAKSLLGGR